MIKYLFSKKLIYCIIITIFSISVANSEVKKVDSFFANIGGRFIYEAEFDKNEDIIRLIHINDFKQLKSSNGCFKISFFDEESKIYKFLKKNNLNTFCNSNNVN